MRAGKFLVLKKVADDAPSVSSRSAPSSGSLGVHIGFGDPCGFETGADWDCPSHIDAPASHATVSVDGRPIMENGRFLV